MMEAFSNAVKTVLGNWTALQLAVQHQAGGPQSKEIAEWMTTVIENYIKDNDDLIPQEIEEYIEDILSNEFNTLCEDGSLEEIGKSLLKYYQMAKTGKEEELKKELEKYKGSGTSQSKAETINCSDSEDDQTPRSPKISDAAPKKKNQQNEPDEDGWVTVTKGKK